jgi:hypothetical protein
MVRTGTEPEGGCDMTTDQYRQVASADTGASPVDDRTYNVLQALTSTLESIAVYEGYAEDDGDDRIFERLITDEREHARLLLAELRTRLGSA